MKIIKSSLLTVILIFSAHAQSAEEAVSMLEAEQGFGVRALSLGSAYEGISDDYSALYWNPAGLAQIRHHELSGALSHLSYGNDVNYLSTTTSGKRNYTKLQNFGLVYPFPVARGNLVMAFGYQRVNSLDNYAGFGAYLPSTESNYLGLNISNELGDYGVLGFDSDVQQQKTVSSEGSLGEWSFGMALEVSPAFSAGFALNLLSGSSEYQSKYEQDDINGINVYDIFMDDLKIEELYLLNYQDKQTINTEYSGFQAKLGGMYKAGDKVRLGGTITLPSIIRVDEAWANELNYNYDIYVLDDETTYQFLVNEDLGSGVFDYNIIVPFQFSGGISYQNSLFLLTASASYSDWSQLRYEMPDDRDSEDYTALLDQNEVFANDFQAVLSHGIGVEVNLFDNALFLRGGYRYVPSSIKDSDVSSDKKLYTAGLGMKLDRDTFLDVTYIYGSHQREAYYRYDWDYSDDIPAMETSQDLVNQKILVGMKLIF